MTNAIEPSGGYLLDLEGAGIQSKEGRSLTVREVVSLLDVENSPIRSSLPELRFSRVPLQPVLRLVGEFPQSLQIEYVLRKGAEYRPALFDSDQFVFGATWHPVDIVRRDEIAASLAEMDIALGPISAAVGVAAVATLEPRRMIIEEYTITDSSATSALRRIPEGLDARLFPYQHIGFTRLCGFAAGGLGGLLADEMGLGKTLQAIALLVELGERAIVVAPASLLENWQREIERFAPAITVFRHAGGDRPGVSSRWAGFDVVLTTYEVVVNDIGILTDVEWPLVVLDEAQQIRNPESQRSVAVKRLTRQRGLAITGTPIENSLSDLWSLSEFVIPGLLGRLDSFRESFPDDESAAARLGSIVSPVVIRRRVSEVAKDLPERLDRWIAFELESGIRAEYEMIESSRSAFEANTALRVLCAHADPALDDQRRFEVTSKCSRLVELLEEIFELGEKVLVFASFTATIARIHQMLVARFPGGFFEMVTGETAGVERQRIIDRFQSSKNPGGLILNPRAAGVGLNITAANHVIHFNPEYNPAVTAQATARAFRRGQTRTVFVHHFYYVNSVEERSVDIASSKIAVAEGLDHGIAESEWRDEAEFL